MTKKVFKLTAFVIIGIIALYWMQEPNTVRYVQQGIVIWNWSIDRFLNFRLYHPIIYMCLPLVMVILLASGKRY